MKFIEGRRYWSEYFGRTTHERYEIYVVRRYDSTNLLRLEAGFALPANYKIRKEHNGREWVKVKGHIYKA